MRFLRHGFRASVWPWSGSNLFSRKNTQRILFRTDWTPLIPSLRSIDLRPVSRLAYRTGKSATLPHSTEGSEPGCVRRQISLNLYYTHLPTSFKRFRCEVNRKKSKYERYGLVTSIEDYVN